MEPSGRTMPTLTARRPNGFQRESRRVSWACLPSLGFRLPLSFVFVACGGDLVRESLVSLSWLPSVTVLLLLDELLLSLGMGWLVLCWWLPLTSCFGGHSWGHS